MLPIERGKPAVVADRDLALRARVGAIEARAGRRTRRWRAGLALADGCRRVDVRLLGRDALASAQRSAAAGGADPRQRRQRRDDRVGVAQQDDVAAAVRGRLDRIIDVGRQRAAAADHRHSRRQVERQRARAVDRAGRSSSLSSTGFSIRTHRVRRELVEGRLVAAAQLRRAAEQLALDEVVGRLAGAALLAGLVALPATICASVSLSWSEFRCVAK